MMHCTTPSYNFSSIYSSHLLIFPLTSSPELLGGEHHWEKTQHWTILCDKMNTAPGDQRRKPASSRRVQSGTSWRWEEPRVHGSVTQPGWPAGCQVQMEDFCSYTMLFLSPLCLQLQVLLVQTHPFSPTNYPVQLVGMAEHLLSIVKSYKLSRLNKPCWTTRADVGKAVGNRKVEGAGLVPLTWKFEKNH